MGKNEKKKEKKKVNMPVDFNSHMPVASSVLQNMINQCYLSTQTWKKFSLSRLCLLCLLLEVHLAQLCVHFSVWICWNDHNAVQRQTIRKQGCVYWTIRWTLQQARPWSTSPEKPITFWSNVFSSTLLFRKFDDYRIFLLKM